ncbi:amino-acid N-acetyltransferase [Puniceicoccus vermicola]|uniref:amino-acid N-acetyltransferase n=1 Tax=Puniceicoccus vermicola TaxID=388746 RepID=A0A7X1E794_9BACT|nr:amino-acid N-acetyltransferase [Puniceicoccus vermicola]MBC2603487.1 amino-acid N-acetyltransferase [Puniceicoccus vermicola]
MSTETRTSSSTDGESPIKPTDLRGILKYVPMFRGQTFIISVDGSVVAHEGFRNLLMDLAVFRSLNIRVVLVHGVGQQIRSLGEKRGVPILDAYGSGPTNEEVLQLAIESSGDVSTRILSQFTELGVSCAIPNAIRATERGIIRGEDFLFTGKVEKVDAPVLEDLLSAGITPLVSPVAANRSGQILRVNSDAIAAEIAAELKASKLIFLTSHPGLPVNGQSLLNVPAEDLRRTMADNPSAIPAELLSKVESSLSALAKGTPRAHILDGRIFGALLTEVFDKVGLGTMIHSNEYDQIRPARPSDLHSLYNLIRNAASSDAVRERSFESIQESLSDFFLYEIDGSLVACAALIPYPKENVAEVGSVFVQPFYQGRGVGLKMIHYAEREAFAKGFDKLFALSTQTFSFFREVCHFSEATLEDLPQARQEILLHSGRRSKILMKDLKSSGTPS